MGSPVFLGLDIGTQSVKCVICVQGSEVDIIHTGQSRPFSVHHIPTIPGAAEQDPSDWLVAIKEAVRDAIKSDATLASRICAVGVSGQQHGLISIGRNGRVLRPCMLWCDTRAKEEAAEISVINGVHTPAGYTSPKMLWMLRHEPDLFDETEQFMLPHDYINFYLAGGLLTAAGAVGHEVKYQHTMECGDASGTGLFDVTSRSLDRQLMDFIHPQLHQKLPDTLSGASDCVGYVHPLILADLFGEASDFAPRERQVLLSAGSGDNAMTLLGASALKLLTSTQKRVSETRSKSPLLISLGTSGTVMIASDKAPNDPKGVVSCFADATGRWMPLVCVQNCARVPQELLASFCSLERASSAAAVKSITSAAAHERVGSEGVLVLPYFSEGGERTPDWPHAFGCLLGLRHGHLQRPALLYRAAVEGVTCALLRGFRRMQQLGSGGAVGTEILIVGGGSHSELWLQIIADMFELPVATLPPRLASHVGALGAVAQCSAVFHSVDVGTIPIRVAEMCSASDCYDAMDRTHFTPTTSVEQKQRYRELYNKHISMSEAIFATG